MHESMLVLGTVTDALGSAAHIIQGIGLVAVFGGLSAVLAVLTSRKGK